ncbi:hypothetical protein ACJX0J_035724, partial [Zea mays]
MYIDNSQYSVLVWWQKGQHNEIFSHNIWLNSPSHARLYPKQSDAGSTITPASTALYHCDLTQSPQYVHFNKVQIKPIS